MRATPSGCFGSWVAIQTERVIQSQKNHRAKAVPENPLPLGVSITCRLGCFPTAGGRPWMRKNHGVLWRVFFRMFGPQRQIPTVRPWGDKLFGGIGFCFQHSSICLKKTFLKVFHEEGYGCFSLRCFDLRTAQHCWTTQVLMDSCKHPTWITFCSPTSTHDLGTSSECRCGPFFRSSSGIMLRYLSPVMSTFWSHRILVRWVHSTWGTGSMFCPVGDLRGLRGNEPGSSGAARAQPVAGQAAVPWWDSGDQGDHAAGRPGVTLVLCQKKSELLTI